MAKLSQCSKCPNHSVAMPYVGRSSKGRIMVIGRKAKRGSGSLKLPVSDYQRFNKITPFAKFLKSILAYDDEFYFTNVIKCPTVKNKHGLKNCPSWLGAEIKLMKPRLIITIGHTGYAKLINSFFEDFEDEWEFLEHRWGKAVMCTYWNYQIEGFKHITTVLPLNIPLNELQIRMRKGKRRAYLIELEMIRQTMMEIRKLHGYKI